METGSSQKGKGERVFPRLVKILSGTMLNLGIWLVLQGLLKLFCANVEFCNMAFRRLENMFCTNGEFGNMVFRKLVRLIYTKVEFGNMVLTKGYVIFT